MEIKKAKSLLEKEIIFINGVIGIGIIQKNDTSILEIAIDKNNLNVEVEINKLLIDRTWHGFNVEFITGAKFKIENKIKNKAMKTENSDSIKIELLTAILTEQMQTKAMLKTLISVSLDEDQKEEFNKKVKTNLQTIVLDTTGNFSFGEFPELKKMIEEMN